MAKPGTFKKGVPRHPLAGRKKGTPNKRSELREALDKLEFNPLKTLVKDIFPRLNASEQKDVCLEMLTYLYIKPKSLEIFNDPENPITVAAASKFTDELNKIQGGYRK